MNISVKSLGIVSGEEGGYVKFVLLPDQVLVFGRCIWHKDLVIAFYGKEVDVAIVGAGILPKNVSSVPLDDEYWGEWKSSGYEIITPPEYRGLIRSVLTSFETEINSLWDGENVF